MRVGYYICRDLCRGRIADMDDEDAPLLKIEFVNEAGRISLNGKLTILEKLTDYIEDELSKLGGTSEVTDTN